MPTATERLYYSDSYLREFEASIVHRADEGRRVYLDRTAFYPTSGGQPFDTGTIDTIPVVDVIDEGELIAHVLSQPVESTHVVGRVNWHRRFDHMQQHTGQHLLSAVIAELLGHLTIAVHFGKDASTIDLDTGVLTSEEIEGIEQRANEVVVENRTLHVGFEEASEALGLRKRPERSGTLRIVTIPGLDRSACGGTHVRTTGEIGGILIRRIERIRKATRIEFVCGSRAIRRARADHELLTRLSAELSASPAELPELISAQRTELKEARAACQELQAMVSQFRARELYNSTQPDTTGVRKVLVREEAAPINVLRSFAQAFTALPKAVFVGATSNPPAVLLATSSDTGIDAAGVLKGLLSAAGGRGGGSPTLAQGVVPGLAQLEQIVEFLAGERP